MSIDSTSEHGDQRLPFGPAISRPGRMPPQVSGAADDPIPPFSPASVHPAAPAAPTPEAPDGGALAARPGADAADRPIDAPEAEVDLTWLDGIDWGDEAVAGTRETGEDASDQLAAAPESEVAEQVESETLPPWISWAEKEDGADKEVHEVSALVEDYGHLHGPVAERGVDSAASAEESPDQAPEAGEREYDALGLSPDASSAALREVADRLESIAASLRGKTIPDLLGETPRADPLELLITGFVLGAATRRAGDV